MRKAMYLTSAAKSLVLVALLRLGSSFRLARRDVDSVEIGGVTVYNYQERLSQHGGISAAGTTSAEFDWVVVFSKTARDHRLFNFCGGGAGQKGCKSLGHPDKGGVPFVTLSATETRLRELLEAHPGEVDFVEPDIPVDIPADLVEPSTETTPWHMERVGVPSAQYTGKGVHIFIMDTGVRTSHNEFGGRALPTVDTIEGRGSALECNGDQTCAQDYHGHGTHVAGTAGGTNYGVAPDALLYSMKVCCGAGTNTLGGMDWVLAKGQRPAIVSVSLASKSVNQAARVTVDKVVAGGVTVVVGAANDNVDTCTMTYGFIPSAIAVGATDSTDKRATFSNFGPCNDIYAPGVAILSAWLGSDTDTRVISGTSMATPVVSGTSALILEEKPDLTPAEILAELQRRSVKDVITDLKEGDPNMLASVLA